MQAYWVNDEAEVYAAHSCNDAIASYLIATGEMPAEGFPVALTDTELDREYQEMDENEKLTGNTTTIRTYLAEATHSGYLCGGPM